MLTPLLSLFNRPPKRRDNRPAPGDRAPSGGVTDWSDHEHLVVEHYIQSRQLCPCQIHGSERRYQTMVLAVKHTHAEMLIDHLFPAPPADANEPPFRVDIFLFNGAGTIKWALEVIEHLDIWGNAAHRCRIVGKTHYRERRFQPQIDFLPRAAPKVDILLPMGGLLRGELAQLSCEGLVMSCFRTEKPELISRKVDCTLYLHEHLVIKCSACVKRMTTTRQPSKQLRISAAFEQLGAIERDQIRAFINELERLHNSEAIG